MSYSIMNPKKFQRNTTKPGSNPKVFSKNNRGNWAFSFFQKNKEGEKQKEQVIKAQCPTGNFDHSKIDFLMNPYETNEQIIMRKYENGEKLNSREKIIVKNILSKQQQEIDYDIEQLKRFGLNATVKTEEGRMRKLIKVLQHYIKQNNNEMVYYVSQKLEEFDIPYTIKREYSDLFEEMEEIIEDVDVVELQFTKFHSNMPPLNQRGFIDLDPFQKDVIRNIDAKRSTILQAPTSAGKSIMTGYLYTKKCNVIVVVPTDILAWQMASMIGKINGKDIPIITQTFQSFTESDELIENINRCGIIVGTPKYLLDYLPMVDVKFDWVVVDEVHMIGKSNCSDMETIIKAYSDVPILALSATIGNVEYLKQWFQSVGQTDIDTIVCNKRFFNLQRFYYEDKKIKRINPLSMVEVDDFINGNISKMELTPTPPDIWELAIKLIGYNLENDLIPYTYFGHQERISLDRANQYFKDLIKFISEKLSKEQITNLISQFKHSELEEKECDLIDMSMTLKDNDKTPALIFHTNTFDCLELVKNFSKEIKQREDSTHPNLLKERLKEQSRAKHMEKKKDSMKINDMSEKQQKKLLLSGELEELNCHDGVSLNEPHIDFIFNKHQKFQQHYIDGIYKDLKEFFPMNGIEYHYLIDLLWRGVGVYVKGLPDPYLRIVQNLACGGELAIVFSDESLVFGVSMPFRTTVITKDDNIDSMMYHQMAGRAGRRGLDKEGNVVFVGCGWNDITELSVSCIPNIDGKDTMSYGGVFAKKLSSYYSSDINRWDNIKSNFLMSKITNDISTKFYNDIETNLANGWEYMNIDNKYFYQMVWKLRDSLDCYRIPYLIQFIKKIFRNCNPTNQNTQVEFAKLMCKYMNVQENDTFVLTPVDSIEQYTIDEDLTKLMLEVPDNIDSRLYESIRSNTLYKMESRKETNQLREQLLELGESIKHLQHYFYYTKEINITRMIGKLLTRIWWIYHMSSPIME